MARSGGRSHHGIAILILIVVSVALTAMDYRGRGADHARTLAAHVFAPGQGWLKNFTLSLVGGSSEEDRDGAVSAEEKIAGLREALRRAEADNVALMAQLADEKRRTAELARLSDEMLNGYPLKLLPAQVVSRQYLLPHGDMKINAGSSRGAGRGQWVLSRYLTRGRKDGVREGQPVLAGNGLVGVIEQTTDGTSQVRLVTSERCVLAARVMHWDASGGGKGQWVPQVDGHLQGTGDGRTMKLTMIPTSASVAPGDYVVASGDEAGLPEYVIIGVVTEVSHLPNDLSYRITVRPRVDLDGLEQVYVLAPGGAKR